MKNEYFLTISFQKGMLIAMNSNISQKFAYEIVNGSAVIWRCFSRASKAVIPSELEGYPVAGIAPYVFSAHLDEKMLYGKKYISENKIFKLCSGWSETEDSTGTKHQSADTNAPKILYKGIDEIDTPQLCGNKLEEIVLPHTVKRVGRYCFYNCKNLHRISFTDALIDWGSGTFTGCHQVQELEVVMYKEEKTTLKDVLVELQEPLVVDYKCENGEKSYYAKLVFPEYYEEGVENTPARLINLTIHGSGMRFRNCFQKRVFDFVEYDSRFPHAVFQEKFEIVGRMAEWRLRYPHELRDDHREAYKEYLIEHRKEYGELLVDRRQTDSLIWFTEMLFSEENDISNKIELSVRNDNISRIDTWKNRENNNMSSDDIHSSVSKAGWIDEIIDYAARKQYQEAVSFLMDYRHRHKPVHAKKKRSFDFDL